MLGMTGDALVHEMLNSENSANTYILVFYKDDQAQDPLVAANENQQEGIVGKIMYSEIPCFSEQFSVINSSLGSHAVTLQQLAYTNFSTEFIFQAPQVKIQKREDKYHSLNE